MHSKSFKMYIPTFYGRTTQETVSWRRSGEWLFESHLDNPVFFAERLKKAEELEGRPDIEALYRKGGNVFYVRRTTASVE